MQGGPGGRTGLGRVGSRSCRCRISIECEYDDDTMSMISFNAQYNIQVPKACVTQHMAFRHSAASPQFQHPGKFVVYNSPHPH